MADRAIDLTTDELRGLIRAEVEFVVRSLPAYYRPPPSSAPRPQAEGDRDWLSSAEVRKAFRIGRTALLKLVHGGQIPFSIRHGRGNYEIVMFRRGDVARVLEVKLPE